MSEEEEEPPVDAEEEEEQCGSGWNFPPPAYTREEELCDDG
jgi:hypothetical protein